MTRRAVPDGSVCRTGRSGSGGAAESQGCRVGRVVQFLAAAWQLERRCANDVRAEHPISRFIGAGLGATITASMAPAFQDLSHAQIPRATNAINVVQRVAASLGTALLAVVLQRTIAANVSGFHGGIGLAPVSGVWVFDVAWALAAFFGPRSLAARLLGVRIGPVAALVCGAFGVGAGLGLQRVLDGDASEVAPSLRIR
jgi:hypothetical protein